MHTGGSFASHSAQLRYLTTVLSPPHLRGCSRGEPTLLTSRTVVRLRARRWRQEARRKAIDQPDRTIRHSQKQCAGVRRDYSAIKPRDDGAAFYRCKIEQFCVTLCRHRGAPRINKKSF